jgi:hypothetical protein
MKRTMILAAAIFALAACDEKKTETKPEEGKTPTTTNATAAAPAATPQPVTIADGDLSTPADFEETAEKAISKTNYKTELASLEADIAKE